MPKFIADFHIHSRYSRATSPDMRVDVLNEWAKKKGIGLLGTGDFTHPAHYASLKEKLEPTGTGLFRLKGDPDSIAFMLTSEVSNIYKHTGKTRRIHTMIFAPDFPTAEGITRTFAGRGNVRSDGRPIFGFSIQELVRMVLGVSDKCLIVPAHIWTPWFSIFGDKSGYDSMAEAFGDLSRYIKVVETGLSSDPSMNWRWSALDQYTLISNSDAHSPSKLGREANILDCELGYDGIVDALTTRRQGKILETVEFFPEEGKYHFDGHRNCGVVLSPEETASHQGRCPKCGKPVTVGVLSRVVELADRKEGFRPPNAVPFRRVIPLQEVLGQALKLGPDTAGVTREYERIIGQAGTEFRVLLDMSAGELSSLVSERILEGILRMREGKVSIIPGHDGTFGKISLYETTKPEEEGQMGLF